MEWAQRLLRVSLTMDPLASVSPRTRTVYHVIATHIATEGYAPSIRELCQLLDLRSTSTVAYHLDALRRAKLISNPPGANRAITITKIDADKSHRCPTCGHIGVEVDVVAMAQGAARRAEER